jgi:LysM repeat protein/ABC-type branched-subunit amino acid transport system substrate-binding protein
MGMIKLRFLLFTAVVLLSSVFANAQDYPQRMRDGKMCYVYTVAPGNTLYGIARQFSADVNAIRAVNPDTAEGLSIGQEVYIPLDSIDKRSAKGQEVKLEGEYIMHTVQRKETLFSIAKIYNVSLNELMEYNPDASTTLSTGAVLKIPLYKSKDTDPINLEPARNDTFMVHQVQTGETIYSLSKTYNVSADSLKLLNKGISDELKVGQWLVIPKFNETYKAAQLSKVPAGPVYPSGKMETYRIALMLPFELYNRDSISKHIEMGKNMPLLTEISLEFHRGVQLAIDSLQKRGFSAEVYVYDVGEDAVDARQIIKRPEMKDMQLIFGPLHKASLAVVSETAKLNHTYIVSPNTFTNEIFESNPYLFKAVPTKETMMRYLATYVANSHQKHNVLMVNSERSADAPYRNIFKQYYNDALKLSPNFYNDSLKIAVRRSFDGANIHTHLRRDVLNVLVVTSNELAFVSDFMTRLSRLRADGYEVQLYGLDQWVGYDNIEAEYKNRFKLRLVVPSFTDYNDEVAIDFLRKYRAAFDTEPNKMNYGFMGYDLMMFFGLALMQNGLDFTNDIEQLQFDGTNNSYRFGHTKGVDFENKAVTIIEYSNFEVRRVN